MKLTRHLIAATIGAAMTLGPAAATASASPPPVTGTVYACQTKDAGYVATAGPSGASVWVPAANILGYSLHWELCVARTSTGARYAIVRLSSPGPTLLSSRYRTFTGIVTIKLQVCLPYSKYSDLETGQWQEPTRVAGSLSGSWYYWPWKTTPSLASTSFTSFRVTVSGYGAVDPDYGGGYISLTPSPYGGTGMIGATATVASGCVNP